MASIPGFSGALIRAKESGAVYDWYERHLALSRSDGTFVISASTQRGPIAFASFRQVDEYFPLEHNGMINLQVDDLDVPLDRLAADGVTVDPKTRNLRFRKVRLLHRPRRPVWNSGSPPLHWKAAIPLLLTKLTVVYAHRNVLSDTGAITKRRT
jgi:hypothetical protein